MRLFTATTKSTGERWYYRSRRIFGRTQYSGCVNLPADHAPLWANTLTEARKLSTERGTLLTVAAADAAVARHRRAA